MQKLRTFSIACYTILNLVIINHVVIYFYFKIVKTLIKKNNFNCSRSKEVFFAFLKVP